MSAPEFERATGDPIRCDWCATGNGCCDGCALCCCENPGHAARWFDRCPRCGQGRREPSLAALAPTDTTADEGQVILGQIGEHCEPGPCSACGKSASACGRAREYCCSPCSTSRFETHHTTADEGGAR